MTAIGVIGAGAWGTALAGLVAKAGHETRLWAREPEVVTAINTLGENDRFLPGIVLNRAIKASGELVSVAAADLLILATPAQHARTAVAALAAIRPRGAALLICAKGIERSSALLMSEVAEQCWPGAQIAVLSGPTFAREVAQGKPAAVTIAATDAALGGRFVSLLGGPTFRPYLSDDPIGAQIGGALKNVLAIAAGIAIGRELGENARAALITRGFSEMARLALAKGAKLETLSGLSGLGDLVLTATSEQSRNYSLGRALGEGRLLATILGERASVVEGVESAPAVIALARRHKIELPIARAVHAVLFEGAEIDDTIGALLSRPFKHEGPEGLSLDHSLG
jgi:glycerol-3-phosphate dehydrogenase (NAD(P)+)